MNKRMFAMAALLSAMPLLAQAENLSLAPGDFLSAEKLTEDGNVVLSVKLSKSGKAKIRELNRTSVGQMVHVELGDLERDIRLVEPIEGDQLKISFKTPQNAERVVARFNGK